MNIDNGKIYEKLSDQYPSWAKADDKELLEKERLVKLTDEEKQAIETVYPEEKRPEELAWYRWRCANNFWENPFKDIFIAGFKAGKEWK